MGKKKEVKGEIRKLKVITYDSALVFARNILSITETSWSHGVDCIYNRKGTNFYDVLWSSSLYLASIGSRFTFNYHTYFCGTVKFLVTRYKSYLTVEVSLILHGTYSCKEVFKFPNYLVNLLALPDQLVPKDSTILKALCRMIECARENNVRDTVIKNDMHFQDYTELEIDLFTENIKNKDELQKAVYTCIENAFFPTFKNLFIILAYMDFLKENGTEPGRSDDGTFYLTDENLSYVFK